MAKRKIDLDKLKKAGKQAHLKHKPQTDGQDGALEIPLNKIVDNPYQPRIEMSEEELKELCDSIESHGLLQPVLVTKGEGGFSLVAGHRRVEACKRLGKKSIKALLLNDADDREKFVALSLIENIQRVNLDPLETAMACRRAMQEGVYKTQSELAKSIGKSKIFVSKLMGVLKLDEEILDDLAGKRTIKDVETLYLLSRIKEKQKQKEYYRKIVAGEINRESLKSAIEAMKNATKQSADFKVKIGKDRITIQSGQIKIPKERVKDFENDLKNLLRKYAS